MTQQELAAAVGVSRPAVVLWESHARRIPLARLRAVAKALNCPVSELIGEWGRGNLMRVTDPAERALITLYRQLPEKLQQKHLELFSASVDAREDSKQTRNQRNAGRVAHVGALELAS